MNRVNKGGWGKVLKQIIVVDYGGSGQVRFEGLGGGAPQGLTDNLAIGGV
jgi:hypothetical protein